MEDKSIGLDPNMEIGGMLRHCEEPGCKTITLGGTCVAHDPEGLTDQEYPYGRPFARTELASEHSTAGAI